MDFDLKLLNRTILERDILLTLRFYTWEDTWLSIGYHQKNIPNHWTELSEKGLLKIVRRPSGGGTVLHSGGITYALTYKKPSYKKFSYQKINSWLMNSFSEIGIELTNGKIKRSEILDNCFSSNFISDLIDRDGHKRIGSAQYWKKGSFLQHGEIQLNPPSELWFRIFREPAPPELKINHTKTELINFLKKSFLEQFPNLSVQNIDLKNLFTN